MLELCFLVMSPPGPPPCAETACASKSDAMRAAFARNKKARPADKPPPEPCPPDREELGRHSWTLLHTLAAYFPTQPTADQSNAALGFIRAVAMLYPCRHCAEDFARGIEEHPPKASSREELSVWVCEAHNRVNTLLGKPLYPCTLSKLDARWRSGGPDCDPGLPEATEDD